MRWGLEPADLRVGGLVALVLALRAATLDLAGYGFYHGSNEANYSLLALGYFEHALTPAGAQGAFFNTPPLTSYLIATSFALFGAVEWAARLPSLASFALGIVGIFFLARKQYGVPAARAAALLFAVAPWCLLWFGRAQTDPHLVGLLTFSLACLVHWRNRPWALPLGGIALGLAGAAKQPAILLFAVLGLWLWLNRWNRKRKIAFAWRVAVWTLVGALPLMAYYAYHLATDPGPLVQAFRDELTQRVSPFENVPRDLVHGLVVAFTPVGVGLAAWGWWRDGDRWRRVLTWWMVVYGVFVLYRAPSVHEYWTLLWMPPLAVWAGHGVVDVSRRLAGWRPAWRVRGAVTGVVTGVAVVQLVAGGVLLGLAGDLGDRTVPRAAGVVEAYVEAHGGETVALFLPAYYVDPFAWYVPALRQGSGAVVPMPYMDAPSADEVEEAGTRHDRVLVVLQRVEAPLDAYEGAALLGGDRYDFLVTHQGLWVLEAATR